MITADSPLEDHSVMVPRNRANNAIQRTRLWWAADLGR
jgi:hypothetical protein